MVAAYHNGRADLTALHHFVERQSQAMALPQTHPTNACRQSLKLDSRTCHVEPLMQVRIVRYQFLDLGVGLVDVLRVAGECYPAKRTDAPAEERGDGFGNKTREIEGMGDAGIESHLPNDVAVVEDRQSHALEAQQILDVLGHRARCGRSGARRVAEPPFIPLFDGPA